TFLLHFFCASHVLQHFPTRRSSDLKPSAAGSNWFHSVGWHLPKSEINPYDQTTDTGRPSPLRGPCLRAATGVHQNTTGDGRPQRSEEHTSELQSRENLVCRLLLEKK